MLEEPRPVGPFHHLPALLRGKAGDDEIPDPSALVERRHHADAGAGERTGALDGLFKDSGQIEALADAEDRRAQPGCGVARGTVHGPTPMRVVQFSTPAGGEAARLRRTAGEWRIAIAGFGGRVTGGT